MIDFSIVFAILFVMLVLVVILGIKLSDLHSKYCKEVRKRDVRDGLLKSTKYLLENTECSLNVCHCGESMDGHSVLSNHSPVDMGHTMADRLLTDITNVLSEEVNV